MLSAKLQGIQQSYQINLVKLKYNTCLYTCSGAGSILKQNTLLTYKYIDIVLNYST